MATGNLWIYGIIGEAPKGSPDKYYSFNDFLNELDPAAEDYTVHIYSPGGDVFEGQAIYNGLINTGKKIKVLIEGVCASIATLIAAAADPGQLFIQQQSQFMIHPPVFNNISGDENQLRTGADQLKQIKQLLINVYRKRTGLPQEKLMELVNRTTWMLPEEAKNLGFVDGVVESMKAVAYADFNKINMESKILQAIEALGNKISNAWRPKNESATLADGTVINVDSTDGEWVGKSVVKEDGSPLEPGEYPLSDGRVLVVGDGSTVAELRDAVVADQAQQTDNNTEMEYKTKFEAAEARIKELESALEARNSASNEQEVKIKSLENKINIDMKALNDELTSIKTQTAGDRTLPKKAIIDAAAKGVMVDPMQDWYKRNILDVRNTD